jgi:uncharacterized protein (TIGR00369 family)
MHSLNEHPLIKAYIAQNNFGKLLDTFFVIHDHGNIEYQLTVADKHLATPNAMHGGCIAALLDATLGVGALTLVCEQGMVVSTLEFKVTFLNACELGDELTSISTPLKKGNRMIFMEAQVLNQNNIIVAKASATLNAYPKEKAGYKV